MTGSVGGKKHKVAIYKTMQLARRLFVLGFF